MEERGKGEKGVGKKERKRVKGLGEKGKGKWKKGNGRAKG